MQILGLTLRNFGGGTQKSVSAGRLGDSVVCSSVTSTASEADPVGSSALPQNSGDAMYLRVLGRSGPILLCSSMTPPVM